MNKTLNPQSHPKNGPVVGGLSLEQLEQLAGMAGSDASASEAAKLLKSTRRIVAPMLKAFRDANKEAQKFITPMAQAKGQPFLPNHRLPDNRIDWDGVHGYVDTRAAVREDIQEAQEQSQRIALQKAALATA